MTELFRVNANITVPARDKYEAVQRVESALAAVPAIQSFDIPPSVARVVPQAEVVDPVRYLACKKGHNHITRYGVDHCDGTVN